jgi:hypothetical protein
VTETEPPLEEKIRHRFLLPYTPGDEKHIVELINVLEWRATIYRNCYLSTFFRIGYNL